MEEKQENQKEEKVEKKKLTAFQTAAIVLVAILFVAIIVQICVIVALKTKTDDLTKENDNVTLECVIEERTLNAFESANFEIDFALLEN